MLKTFCSAVLMGFFFLTASLAQAQTYNIDKSASTLAFKGEHAGNVFEGTFESWDAEIVFDPATPEQGHIAARINLGTAKTGNKMYDGTLPEADWFDVKNHPLATFVSTEIHSTTAEGDYQVAGDLTIRGVTKPVRFTFTLDNPEANDVRATAELPIKRSDFQIGMKSDPDAEWVGETVHVIMDVHAQRQ